MYFNETPRIYKGHTIGVDLIHDDGDCIKWDWCVEKPDGTVLYPDVSPYNRDYELLEKWIDAGYPRRISLCTLREDDLDKIILEKETS